jgi:hypothetical protein
VPVEVSSCWQCLGPLPPPPLPLRPRMARIRSGRPRVAVGLELCDPVMWCVNAHIKPSLESPVDWLSP